MSVLTHDRYCDEIAHRIGQLRDVVTSGADLSATVPTCPDWSLEDLVRHVGGALRRVDALARARARENIPAERVPAAGGPAERGDAAALDRWLAESGEPVVGALREAGPGTPVWAWAGVPTAGIRARRMTHEITVHRADTTLAAEPPYEVAADALDEWLRIAEWVRRGAPVGQAGAGHVRLTRAGRA
ncbi:hypothetical protein ACE1SV_46950 [Streptomyces sp. E-15]